MPPSTERPLVRLIVGSVRPIRVGDQLAEAIAPIVAEAADARVELVDLAELDLPLLDEPRMPAMGDYQREHTKAWSRIVAESDAVVFVTPQYNGGYPAALKNAIDFLFHEWRGKPALIVSYGGHGGGLSGAQLRGVLEFIGLELAGQNVELTLPRDGYDEGGRLRDAAAIVASHEEPLRAAAATLRRVIRSTAPAPAA